MQEQNSFGKLKKFENRKDNNFLLGFPVSEKRKEHAQRLLGLGKKAFYRGATVRVFLCLIFRRLSSKS